MSALRSTLALLLATVVPLVAASTGLGADHVLVIGGGYEPSGNQVSLEKNVLRFRSMLGEFYPSGVGSDVFFSDGGAPGRDLQYREPEENLPRVNVLLAQVLRQTDSLGELYRSSEIPGLRGASSIENLRDWFRSSGRSLGSGDRLIIYVTAHGGKGSEEDPRNTVLYLWNREELRVRDLSALIDELDDGVQVVLFMVQCYAGGFAELAFQEADRDQGPNRANICGFFATTHDRPAAGCTPEINEENYREYSTAIWEALRGKTRTDEPISRVADLDGDGLVSFAEAHAHALIASPTADLSTKTSDAFLRHYSRLDDGGDLGLASSDTPCDWLIEQASPPDRAVIEGLSEALGLSESGRATEARRRADATSSESRRLDRSIRQSQARADSAADRIQNALYSRWPELKNRWNPGVTALLTSEAPAVRSAIENHPSFADFERHQSRLADLRERRAEQDRIWTRCHRLIRTLENVALEFNLPRVASDEVVDRYRLLVSAESSTLGPPPARASAALAR